MFYNSPKQKHLCCAIYRGPGGSGDAVNDSSSETRLAVEARDAALAAQAAAEAAQAAAETAETNAETAETNAETAETNAETAATSAASSASTATTKASEASTSATNAASSASAASTSATNAASSASAASTSASNASTSATNAASSASSASTSATSAASSASSASTSASTATTKASEASTSATNAASSASSASSSASTATTQAGIATTKASEASTSATNAASSASSASTSATNAASSATAAQSAQTAAESARDAALSAYDNFDDRYLGPKSSDPTLDNDGSALVSGALYFNTATNVMKVYDGSTWVAAYVSAAGVLLAANNLSDLNSVSTARTNLGLGTAATTAATDYATAAQGAKADTALQPAAIGVTVQGYDADLAAFALKTAPTGDVVGTSDTQTLTNKTISGASNTLSNIGNSSLTNSSITIGGSAVSLGGTVGTLGVAYGGTGLTSLTAGYIPYGNGTSAFSSSSSLYFSGTNLGVGTATTLGKVTTTVSDAGGEDGFYVSYSGGSTKLASFTVNSNTGEVKFGATGTTYTSFFPTFYSGGSERMRITSSGNVGIGTSSPTDRLHVYSSTTQDHIIIDGPAAINRTLKYTTAGSQRWAIYCDGDAESGSNVGSNLRIARYDDSGVYIAPALVLTRDSGNLGLGVTPSAWSTLKAIQVGSGAAFAGHPTTPSCYALSNAYFDGTNWKYIATNYAAEYRCGGSDGIHAWYNAPSGTAGNAISFTQAMTLDASGNLIVGDTSTPGGKFYMKGNYARFTDGTYTGLFGKGSDLVTGGGTADLAIRSDSAILFSYGSTERMRIDSSGNVGIGGTAGSIFKLDVYGNSAIRGGNKLYLYNGSNGNYSTIHNASTSTDDSLVFSTNAEAMRIDVNGNVGIGTSSPSTKLDVSGSGNIYAAIRSSNSNAGVLLQNASATYYLLVGGSTLSVYDNAAAATRFSIDSSGNMQFNSGYGSAATAYGCRAWVNFNGTGTVAIRASGNVSSITDNGTGDYTVNFTTAMPDANYATFGTTEAGNNKDYTFGEDGDTYSKTTSAVRMQLAYNGNLNVDSAYLYAAFFR